MTAKRRRPLLVNLAWCIVPAAYFASWLALHWLYGRGVFSLDTARTIEKTVFLPLRWYSGDSGLPGGDFLLQLADRCIDAGINSSLPGD